MSAQSSARFTLDRERLELKRKIAVCQSKITSIDARISKGRQMMQAAFVEKEAVSAELDDLMEVTHKAVAPIRLAINISGRHFEIRPDDIIGPRRLANINHARHVAMWIATHGPFSLGQIGRSFKRHHSTVLHGRNAMTDQRRNSAAVRAETDMLFGKWVEAADLADLVTKPLPEVFGAKDG